MRTSSLVNCGDDKNSGVRQSRNCKEYAKLNGYDVQETFYDEGVSGSTNVYERDAFKDLIFFCKEHNIMDILVEKNDRFCRSMMEQEIAIEQLSRDGFNIISTTNGDLDDGTPERKAIRQMMGVFAEYEASAIAQKLKIAREWKAKENKKNGYITIDGSGKCSGRKSYAELQPELVKEAKRLRKKNGRTQKQRSYDKVAMELYELGFRNLNGNKFSATTIKNICMQRVN